MRLLPIEKHMKPLMRPAPGHEHGVPAQLRADLLRTAEALHLSQELTEYQHLFPGHNLGDAVEELATTRSSARDQL